MPATPTPPPRWPTHVAAAVLLLAMVAVWIGRIHLAPMPLDRDEGEYAYMGQLLLQGVPPYQQALNMKLPGTSAAYAVVMALLGQTPAGIHYGLLLINAVTAGFVFLLGRRLLDPLAGMLGAACYLVVSFAREIHGMSANAEHFVLLCAIPGLWLVLRYLELERPRDVLLGGLLLGAGVVMKQHGAAFALAGGAALLAHELRRRPLHWPTALRRAGLFAAAAVLPLLLTCLALAAAGVFDNFRFWVFDYSRSYGAQLGWSDASGWLATITGRIFRGMPAPWLIAGAGLAAAALSPELRRRGGFLASFVGASILAVCPGLFFRPHYFVFLLPAASVLFGAAVGRAIRWSRASRLAGATAVVLGLAASSLALSVFQQADLWYRTDPDAASRAVFAGNPFAESKVFADYIRRHSAPDTTVAVVGSEPQIPFYARRRSATAYIYMYPLMEDQPHATRMQAEAIAEIEAASPRYAVYALNPLSWLINNKSTVDILEWFDRYRAEHYRAVGLAFLIQDPDGGGFLPSRYYWDEEAEKMAAQVWPVQVDVLARKRTPVMVLLERRD